MSRFDRHPQFTGIVNRAVYIRGNRLTRKPHEFIVEMYDSRNTFTFIAYGNNATLLAGFMHQGRAYVVDYIPHSSGEYNGEAVSARDRNE